MIEVIELASDIALYATPPVFLPHPGLYGQVAPVDDATLNTMVPSIKPYLTALVCESMLVTKQAVKRGNGRAKHFPLHF